MDTSHPARKPIIRRDAEGAERTAPTWESLTERLIREASESGRFDDLPGHGKPLSLDDDAYAGEMAAAFGLLRDAGMAPPWIEADKDAREALRAIDTLLESAPRATPIAHGRLRRDLVQLMDRHDAAATRLEGAAPTPHQHRRRIDRVAVLDSLEEALLRSAR